VNRRWAVYRPRAARLAAQSAQSYYAPSVLLGRGAKLIFTAILMVVFIDAFSIAIWWWLIR
jgi:hypothetical protein